MVLMVLIVLRLDGDPAPPNFSRLFELLVSASSKACAELLLAWQLVVKVPPRTKRSVEVAGWRFVYILVLPCV